MVSAIILAAGLSTRTGGENKMLLPYKGQPIILTVVDNIIQSGIDEVIIVTGRNAVQVNDLLQHLPVTTIYNKDFAKGMTTSIQKGISIATANGYMICLGDMPFITPGDYKQMAIFFECQYQVNKECICIPTYNNQKGNPVIFSAFYKKQILEYTIMEGCKEIVQANKQNIFTIEMNSGNVLRDIDTLDEYKDALL